MSMLRIPLPPYNIYKYLIYKDFKLHLVAEVLILYHLLYRMIFRLIGQNLQTYLE